MAYSGERPRRVSPAPDSFWRVGENDGDRVETASTIEPPMPQLIVRESTRRLPSTTASVC